MEKITLKNGLRIILYPQPNTKTASFGVWVKSGSIYETKQNNGISHFIEHMVFKGSKTRSSLDIAEQMDAIGGQLNAYTTKDYTCFYAKTLDEHANEGFDILCDIVSKPLFAENDIKTEKNVILEEINMSEDSPDDKVVENMYSSVFKGSSLAFPILGTCENLNKISKKDLHDYIEKMYSPERIVIAVCGNFNKQKFLDITYKYFNDIPAQKAQEVIINSKYNKSQNIYYKDCEQTHMCICLPGFNAFNKRRYALNILNIIVGGSSSSRLFQKIREDLGLAYSVYSTAICYNTAGLFEIQTASAPNSVNKTYAEIIKILKNIKNGIEKKEFLRAKEQLKSGIIMGLEGNSAKAGFVGRNELLKNYINTEENLLSKINAVTLSEVNYVAQSIININDISISLVGPVDEKTLII